MTIENKQFRYQAKHCNPRYGITILWVSVFIIVLTGIASLAVDYARVQMVKTQLLRTTEAAARYGATGLENGYVEALANAVSMAAANTADNSAVVIDPVADIDIGTWDTGTRSFSALAGNARANGNAIRVTARRKKSRNNAVPLAVGKSVGQDSCDLTVTTICMINRGNRAALNVPSSSNPWLAGNAPGTLANINNPANRPDQAGDSTDVKQSPVSAAAISVTPGMRLTFDSVNGGANNFASTTLYTPDGNTGWITCNLRGAENGKSNCLAPINAVMGVFLGATDPSQATGTPATLDFSTQSARNFQSLSPVLRQMFFIGDGRRDDGSVQQFIVPPGATRLFIGTMDGYEWNNNVGSYTVTAHNIGKVLLVK